MKPTQYKDARRNIRKRLVSYLSICLVIMLGVAAFLTTTYMEAGIIKEAAGYYQDRGFKDFELISSLGVSEKNIETIKSVPGVTDAEGVMQYDGSLRKGDVKGSVTVLSLTERVSAPLLVDGRMPVGTDECAVGEDFAETNGIQPGDSVSIYLSGAPEGDPLKGHKFTVTGLIKHPDYVHRKLTNTAVLPLKAFDMSITSDAYTRVFVKAKDVAFKDVFAPAYFEQTEETRKGLKDIKDQLAADRAGEIKAEAYKQIDKEWAEALAELENAENDINSGEAKLNSELAKGKKELNDAKSTLATKLKKYNKKIKDGEKSIKEGEAELNKARKELEENKKQYASAKSLFESETAWVGPAISDVDKLLTYLDDPDSMSDEDRRAAEVELAELLLAQRDNLQDIIDFANSDDGAALVPVIEEMTGQDIKPYMNILKFTNADMLLANARNVINKEDAHFSKDELGRIKEVLTAIQDASAKLAEVDGAIADAEKQLDEGEATLKAKKAEIKAGKKEIKEEKAKAEKKISQGWAKYYSQRDKYKAEIAEARALLSENREKAEEKLAEAKADVEAIGCEYVVLDRNANAGYVDVKVQLESMRSTGLVFGLLFILITAIVCSSTLTIIIDEQKKLIGTVKAFGFHKREVLSKYLLFGVSAGIVGDILAVLTGLVLSRIVLLVYSASELYQYGRPESVMRPVPTLVIALIMIAVCAVASIFACLDILRSPASLLMKGEVLRKRKKARKAVTSSRGASLYTKLILRNISDDKARVIVSTAIVAFCCMLIGVGISFKLATTGMLAKQQGEINLYDLRVDAGDSVSKEDLAAMAKVLDEQATDYTEAIYEPHLFSAGNTITGLQVLAGDPDKISNYFGMFDSGNPAKLSSDGLIIPLRMSENYGFEKGSNIEIFDSTMETKEASVTGTYTCYFQRVAVTTPEGYSRIFGCDYEPNSFFIHLDGDDQALRKALLDINEDISFETSSDFRKSFESVGMLYNIIVYVTMGIAIFMSFMILTNLASIFVNRKKNELIVMRINGFSIKQAKGYLIKEAVLTTVIGLAVGVIIGSLLTPFAVRILEPADLQFDRSYQPLAWVFAAALEGTFALLIYSVIFNRIKRFDLRDIA